MFVIGSLDVAAKDLDTVETIRGRFAYEYALLFAGLLVHANDSVETPVGDVHPLLVDGD